MSGYTVHPVRVHARTGSSITRHSPPSFPSAIYAQKSPRHTNHSGDRRMVPGRTYQRDTLHITFPFRMARQGSPLFSAQVSSHRHRCRSCCDVRKTPPRRAHLAGRARAPLRWAITGHPQSPPPSVFATQRPCLTAGRTPSPLHVAPQLSYTHTNFPLQARPLWSNAF